MRVCCGKELSDCSYNLLIFTWAFLALSFGVTGICIMALTSVTFYGFLLVIVAIGLIFALIAYLWNCCGWKSGGCCSKQPVF